MGLELLSEDFKGKTLDQALRFFLSLFRLPGEAQQIDRIMEAFAKQYVSSNPKVFDSHDTAYTLSFSLIMLNTDAHNDSITRKMTVDDWLRNNRGIGVDGADLPEEVMRELYWNIVKNEIRMEQREYVS